MVCDNGVGKPDGAIARTPPGLGTSIVEALARQLEADVTVRPRRRMA
jgi:two-component sensor histidine kinase